MNSAILTINSSTANPFTRRDDLRAGITPPKSTRAPTPIRGALPGRSAIRCFAALVWVWLLAIETLAAPLGTAFTYQGAIDGVSGPSNYDLRFSLYDAATDGTRVGGPLELVAVETINGVFTVTLDFGGAFNGDARWLQVEVRPTGSGAVYEVLLPRQPVTPAPYAIYALNAARAASAFTVAPGAVTTAQIADGTIALADLAPGLLEGAFWRLGGNAGTAAGTHFLGTTDNQALDLRVNSARVLRLQPSAAGGSIVGGANSVVHASTPQATISGGSQNSIELGAQAAAISGGTVNLVGANAQFSAIGGGTANSVVRQIFTGEFAATNDSRSAVLGGGEANTILGGSWAVISGGRNNRAVGDYAIIAGGRDSTASSYGFSAGRRAKGSHPGAFLWADSTDADLVSARINEFAIRAAGGVRIESDRGISLNAADTPLVTRRFDTFAATAPAAKQGHGRWGVFMEPSSLSLGMPALAGKFIRFGKYADNGAFTSLAHVEQDGTFRTAGPVNPPSDRNVKQDFSPVDSLRIFERVLALPLHTWSYTNNPAVRHLGPVAQDFHAAFALGADEKTIATVDADGVALAAIQGLNAKLENRLRETGAALLQVQQALDKKESELAELKREVAILRARDADRDDQWAILQRAVFGGTQVRAQRIADHP